MAMGYLHREEIERFAERFIQQNLSSYDRIALEGLVKQCVERFVHDEDEAQQEEFRQLLRSYQRFYSFVAQVVSLQDGWLEKLFAYTSWLSRLLPSRTVPAELTVSDDMLELAAIRVEQQDSGSASLGVGESRALPPITEFGANPYTEEEEKSLSQIIDSFNERHGTTFSREDFLRFERVNREIMDDEMEEMLRNNPADVVYSTFSRAFFAGMIKLFQQDNEMRNIVMTDSDAREQATRHFFKRAQRQAHEQERQR